MSNVPIGDPRPAGEEGPAGDQRPAGEEGPAGDPRPAGNAPDASYDPGEYTVRKVNDHLATVDDAERDRILKAEKKGKARAGIIG